MVTFSWSLYVILLILIIVKVEITDDWLKNFWSPKKPPPWLEIQSWWEVSFFIHIFRLHHIPVQFRIPVRKWQSWNKELNLPSLQLADFLLVAMLVHAQFSGRCTVWQSNFSCGLKNGWKRDIANTINGSESAIAYWRMKRVGQLCWWI